MMKYKIVRWDLIKKTCSKYRLISIKDDFSDLKITLSEANTRKNGQKITIVLACSSYRITNTESKNLKLEYDKKEFKQDNPENETFFEVLNSEFAKDLAKESGGVFNAKDFNHLLLMCSNAIIDVLSTSKLNIKVKIKV